MGKTVSQKARKEQEEKDALLALDNAEDAPGVEGDDSAERVAEDVAGQVAPVRDELEDGDMPEVLRGEQLNDFEERHAGGPPIGVNPDVLEDMDAEEILQAVKDTFGSGGLATLRSAVLRKARLARDRKERAENFAARKANKG